MKHYLFTNVQTGQSTILAEEGRAVTLRNKKLSAIMKEIGECDGHGVLLSGGGAAPLEKATIGNPNTEKEIISKAKKKESAGSEGGTVGTGANTVVDKEEDEYEGLTEQEIADIKAAKAIEEEAKKNKKK